MNARLSSVFLLAALAGCQPGAQKPAADADLYHAEKATRRDIVVAVESAGIIEPIIVVDVKSKASGEILERPVQNGDVVTAGTLMVKVDERVPKNTLAQAQAALDVARARLDNATSQLNRMQKLFATAAVPQADREKTELDVANARAEVIRAEVTLENARISMDDTIVRAPITGTIIQLSVERGQVISSPTMDVGGGTLLLRMADLTTVQVRALVDETDIGKVTPGARAEVTVAAFPNRRFTGHVEKIEPQATAQQNVTMFPVLVRLANEEALLKPGMNAEITLGIADRRGVVAVPTAALRTADDIDAAADVLGLDVEQLRATLAASAEPVPVGKPATGGSASPSTAGADAGGADGESPPVPMEKMRELFGKMRAGETLTDEERKQMAAMRAWRERNGGGRGFAGGGGPGGGGGFAGGGGGPPAGGGFAGGGRGPGGGPGSGPGAGSEEPADPFASARRRSALDAQMGGDFIVFTRTANGVAPRRVRAGITDLDYTEVIAGLDEGAEVLILPSESLVRAQQGFQERIARMTSMPIGS